MSYWRTAAIIVLAFLLTSCSREEPPGPTELELTLAELAETENELAVTRRQLYRALGASDWEWNEGIARGSDEARAAPLSPEARGSDESALARVMEPLSEGQLQILYLADYDREVQLRIRKVPSPGGAAVLWRGPRHTGATSCMPSPRSTRVAMMLASGAWGERHELVVVSLRTGKEEILPERVAGELGRLQLGYFVWYDDETLSILAYDPSSRKWSEWFYQVDNRRLDLMRTHPQDWGGQLGFLEAHFQEPIQVFEKAVREDKVQLTDRYPGEHLSQPILRCVGVARGRELLAGRYSAGSVAAVSPDGEYVALSGRGEAVSVVGVGEHASGVRRVIPRAQLIHGESVSASDLRWTSDSRYLTFTEVHAAWDVTSLVRLYSLQEDEVMTVAIGRNAFVLPSSLPPEQE